MYPFPSHSDETPGGDAVFFGGSMLEVAQLLLADRVLVVTPDGILPVSLVRWHACMQAGTHACMHYSCRMSPSPACQLHCLPLSHSISLVSP